MTVTGQGDNPTYTFLKKGNLNPTRPCLFLMVALKKGPYNILVSFGKQICSPQKRPQANIAMFFFWGLFSTFNAFIFLVGKLNIKDPRLLHQTPPYQVVKGGTFNPITGEAIGDRSDATAATVGVQPGTPGRLGRPPPGADFDEVGYGLVGSGSFFGEVGGGWGVDWMV